MTKMVFSSVERFVNAYSHTIQQIGLEQLMALLPSTVEFSTDDTTDNLIVAEGSDAKSLKSSNAFLSWRFFLKQVCSITLDGFTGYTVPFLLLPAAFKMMTDARELVTQTLKPTHTAVILALYNAEANTATDASLATLFDAVKSQPPFTGVDVSLTPDCIDDLISWGCIRRNMDQSLELIERVEIKSP